MRQSIGDINRRAAYFEDRARRERPAAPEIISVGGSGVGKSVTLREVYRIESVSTASSVGPCISVRKCEMLFSVALGYYFTLPQPPYTYLTAYPHPAVDVLFYQGLIGKMFWGETYNGILFLDAQPWSIY
jgi:hypothetical protein